MKKEQIEKLEEPDKRARHLAEYSGLHDIILIWDKINEIIDYVNRGNHPLSQAKPHDELNLYE